MRERPLHGRQVVLGLVQGTRPGLRLRRGRRLVLLAHGGGRGSCLAVLLLLLQQRPAGILRPLLLLQALGLVVDAVLEKEKQMHG